MEIKFRKDTTFRKLFFVPASFAHPAKMDAQLLIWLVNRYSEAGETILDPMAGSGTTMLACGLGRNVILVELEEKFCKMMEYGENPEQALEREIREELHIILQVNKLLHAQTNIYQDGKHYLVLFYECHTNYGSEPEGCEYFRKQDLKGLDCLPGTYEVLNKIFQQ